MGREWIGGWFKALAEQMWIFDFWLFLGTSKDFPKTLYITYAWIFLFWGTIWLWAEVCTLEPLATVKFLKVLGATHFLQRSELTSQLKITPYNPPSHNHALYTLCLCPHSLAIYKCGLLSRTMNWKIGHQSLVTTVAPICGHLHSQVSRSEYIPSSSVLKKIWSKRVYYSVQSTFPAPEKFKYGICYYLLASYLSSLYKGEIECNIMLLDTVLVIPK